MMTNVTSVQEILEMFTMADKDEDGKINYEEFLIMITPRKVAIQLFLFSHSLVIFHFHEWLLRHYFICRWRNQSNTLELKKEAWLQHLVFSLGVFAEDDLDQDS